MQKLFSFSFSSGYIKFSEETYYTFQGRSGAFVIGMLLGYWLSLRAKSSNAETKKSNKILILLGWIFMLTILSINFFGHYLFSMDSYVKGPMSQYIDPLYNGLQRPAFATVVALLIAYSETGHGSNN